MSILSRTISAITPAVISTTLEAANASLTQWANETKAVNEAFAEDRIKVKVIVEKSRLMADMAQAENSLKKSANKALPRNEVAQLHSLYDQMFSDQPQTIQQTTQQPVVELL